MKRAATRAVRAGSVTIGGGNPIVIQSMCATKTQDIDATTAQAQMLHNAGAGLVRIAVDSAKDVECLAEVRARVPEANLVVDLQENYRLIATVAPHVNKVRYNPGHLYHHEKNKPVREKVAFIVSEAVKHDVALRVGVNCGSVDPEMQEKFDGSDPLELRGVTAMVESALQHCQFLDDLGFSRYVVSLKDSDPRKVIEGNRRFAAARPDVPLHLGVTEAGLMPDGVIKTRIAFEQLLSQGIGDT
ncbi:MAG TPA: flavodoxin-dependent (E)-4-hydroxy-3-methylbut-2-enyl-diphosphate synthase, partial [Tepidiformaceae bacterium]|nr:flavodoxin-dependent (E)-4-hydroxy-3-methylbut-2-enyl-diphosphate synthase [Tepidiformaceae bacterium]